MVSFDVTKEESNLISAIASRGVDQIRDLGLCGTLLDLIMDLTACHANGCPLRLKDLLDAPMFDFYHDLEGICFNINRSTGKLENYFLPRFYKDK
jgi:hypothetical protein